MSKIHMVRALRFDLGDEICVTKCGEHGIVTKTTDGIMRVQTSWEFIEVTQDKDDWSKVTCGMCLAKKLVAS